MTVKTAVETITPTKAKEYLSQNSINRTLKAKGMKLWMQDRQVGLLKWGRGTARRRGGKGTSIEQFPRIP